MEWSNQAIVLSARKHGEGHAVLEVLSETKGRAKGYVKGGSSRRQRPVLEPGNLVSVTWRGRLDEHLGTFRAELEKAVSPGLFRHPSRLAGLNALTALLSEVLPEREECPEIYRETLAFLELLVDRDKPDVAWGAELVIMERMLLARLGFGLDLEACAATGETENLIYISPKTGRAVSREAGKPYRDKLLKLPPFLIGKGEPDREGVHAGLTLTGHFFSRNLFHNPSPAWEDARHRLLNFFS